MRRVSPGVPAINVDECQGNPCGNHGVCADRVGFGECTCVQDTAGKIVISQMREAVPFGKMTRMEVVPAWSGQSWLLSLAGLAGLAGLVWLLSLPLENQNTKGEWYNKWNCGVEAVEMHECAISLVETNPKA